MPSKREVQSTQCFLYLRAMQRKSIPNTRKSGNSWPRYFLIRVRWNDHVIECYILGRRWEILGVIFKGEEQCIVSLSHQLVQNPSEASADAINRRSNRMTVNCYFHLFLSSVAIYTVSKRHHWTLNLKKRQQRRQKYFFQNPAKDRF